MTAITLCSGTTGDALITGCARGAKHALRRRLARYTLLTGLAIQTLRNRLTGDALVTRSARRAGGARRARGAVITGHAVGLRLARDALRASSTEHAGCARDALGRGLTLGALQGRLAERAEVDDARQAIRANDALRGGGTQRGDAGTAQDHRGRTLQADAALDHLLILLAGLFQGLDPGTQLGDLQLQVFDVLTHDDFSVDLK